MTQVILWSNSLHGLWVKQEVAFHQNGPFWIVETSARLPGLWFLVHSFYSHNPDAGRNRGACFRGLAQAAAISRAGAFADRRRAGWVGDRSIIPTFNLLPQAEFNPFIPGIGIAALFYALAVFRFQFLKRTPPRKVHAR